MDDELVSFAFFKMSQQQSFGTILLMNELYEWFGICSNDMIDMNIHWHLATSFFVCYYFNETPSTEAERKREKKAAKLHENGTTTFEQIEFVLCMRTRIFTMEMPERDAIFATSTRRTVFN